MEDFICKRKLYIADGRTGNKIVLLTATHEPCTRNECGFTKKSTRLFYQTVNVFSVDSVQYIVYNVLCRQCAMYCVDSVQCIVYNVLCRQCAMYCVLLLCYHTPRLSSLCKIVCHKATDLCMKKG